MTGKTLHFRVPSGIGDISWLYSKFVSLDRPLSIECVGAEPRRSLPYLNLLPNVVHAGYGSFTTASVLANGDKGGYTRDQLIAEAEMGSVDLQMNHWLEAGKRIEGYLPDVPTQHHYEMRIPEADVQTAGGFINWTRYLALYCANDRIARHWNAWTAGEWGFFGVTMCRTLDLDGIVLLGAEWDADMAHRVQAYIGDAVPVMNMVSRLPLGATLDVVRRATYTAAFPSGIPILASVMRCPVLMFYPDVLYAMRHAWPDPCDIESGRYTGMAFCPPERVVAVLQEKFRNLDWQPKARAGGA
jgi:hypothetical protein